MAQDCLNREGGTIWERPELKKALKIVLKYEIQSLLQRLAQTGEESVVITASTVDGTATLLGSKKGKGFAENASNEDVRRRFVSYCNGVEATQDHFSPSVSQQNFGADLSEIPQGLDTSHTVNNVVVKSEPMDTFPGEYTMPQHHQPHHTRSSQPKKLSAKRSQGARNKGKQPVKKKADGIQSKDTETPWHRSLSPVETDFRLIAQQKLQHETVLNEIEGSLQPNQTSHHNLPWLPHKNAVGLCQSEACYSESNVNHISPCQDLEPTKGGFKNCTGSEFKGESQSGIQTGLQLPQENAGIKHGDIGTHHYFLPDSNGDLLKFGKDLGQGCQKEEVGADVNFDWLENNSEKADMRRQPVEQFEENARMKKSPLSTEEYKVDMSSLSDGCHGYSDYDSQRRLFQVVNVENKEVMRESYLKFDGKVNVVETKFSLSEPKTVASDHDEVTFESIRRDMVKCLVCSKIVKRSSFRHHKALHQICFPFKCSVCMKGFKRKCSLDLHFNSHLASRNRKFSCPCGQKFLLKHHMTRHMTKCEEGKPLLPSGKEMLYKCPYCKHSFRILKSLYEHVKAHEQDSKEHVQ